MEEDDDNYVGEERAPLALEYVIMFHSGPSRVVVLFWDGPLHPLHSPGVYRVIAEKCSSGFLGWANQLSIHPAGEEV